MLVDNVLEFAIVLRKGGLPVPPERVFLAVASLEKVGVAQRCDVHAALSASLVDRHEHQFFFDSAFDLFWADPRFLERTRRQLAPVVADNRQELALPRRLHAAFATRTRTFKLPDALQQQAVPDARKTASAREQFQHADFASMTPEEFMFAQRIAAEMAPPVARILLRRTQISTRGRIDLRCTLHQSARNLDTLQPVYTKPQETLPPIVTLVDISSSMTLYTRVLLHYLHGLAQHHKRLQVFTFGTQLTRVTSALQDKDPDVAMRNIDHRVRDWRGGTHLSDCLAQFTRLWSKRLLGGRTTLILATDGLDGKLHANFAQVMSALHRRSHRIVWLNALLRFDGFEPLAPSVQTLARHADTMVSMHNLQSLQDLQRILRQTRGGKLR